VNWLANIIIMGTDGRVGAHLCFYSRGRGTFFGKSYSMKAGDQSAVDKSWVDQVLLLICLPVTLISPPILVPEIFKKIRKKIWARLALGGTVHDTKK
jgi:hypothetical protein